jgi:hypothetical protein
MDDLHHDPCGGDVLPCCGAGAGCGGGGSVAGSGSGMSGFCCDGGGSGGGDAASAELSSAPQPPLDVRVHPKLGGTMHYL